MIKTDVTAATAATAIIDIVTMSVVLSIGFTLDSVNVSDSIFGP